MGKKSLSGITRRDILHGLGALGATALVPGKALADAVLAMETSGASGYPPLRTGLRGNHVGSFEVAHSLARHGQTDWGPVQSLDTVEYDLVVVGAGISGLAAAYFFKQKNPNARVLLLDNHDDFGGHAKRNEFDVGKQKIIGYGGSQTMENPTSYPRVTQVLLEELGVNLNAFDTAYDQNFYKRHGLTGGTFFNQEAWGVNRLIPVDVANLSYYLPLADSPISIDAAVERMPMSDAAKAQMRHLLTTDTDQLADIPADKKIDYLYSMTYLDFVAKHLGVTEPEVIAALQGLITESGVGIESTSAAEAMMYSGLPGANACGLPEYDGDPYIHHFPDGNASIARALVQWLIPEVSSAPTLEALLTQPFDYSALDKADAKVQLRLSSTVVNVTHRGKSEKGNGVTVTYVKNGQAFNVKARATILACYNSIIPALCPELPEKQREALSLQVKSPILFTSVALTNWRAWAELGIGGARCPGSYHNNAILDFPVSWGSYQFSDNPDQPIMVHMERFPHPINSDLDKREKLRWGRHQLLSTPYETIERNVVQQLSGMLGDGGFDPEKDISAITVNRWAHGYSYEYDFLEEPYYDDWNDPRYPHVRGRQTFGSIAIANCDAGGSAYLDAAIGQAHRAVEALS